MQEYYIIASVCFRNNYPRDVEEGGGLDGLERGLNAKMPREYNRQSIANFFVSTGV